MLHRVLHYCDFSSIIKTSAAHFSFSCCSLHVLLHFQGPQITSVLIFVSGLHTNPGNSWPEYRLLTSSARYHTHTHTDLRMHSHTVGHTGCHTLNFWNSSQRPWLPFLVGGMDSCFCEKTEDRGAEPPLNICDCGIWKFQGLRLCEHLNDCISVREDEIKVRMAENGCSSRCANWCGPR